jgi:hypothetical protein
LNVAAGQSGVVRFRLSTVAPDAMRTPFLDFEKILASRLQEADEFYESLTPDVMKQDGDRRLVMRQALAGMLWTKQYFYYDVSEWLKEHHVDALTPENVRRRVRNAEWFHMVNDDIISMPDKWEYPWYAAWDLAFHTLALSLVDPDFAKHQLDLMLRNEYLHPNGQMPAYEWNFGDVNPPVHAFATMQIYLQDKERNNGTGDTGFLAHAFSKLLVNFTWWINRKDPEGNNVFEGGFLGLDNIGVFDRSSPLPTGGSLEQADGTAWMAFFSQQMLRIAVELATTMPAFEEFVTKFFEHSMWIMSAMNRPRDNEGSLWDEHDGFFYDVLRLPGGDATRLKVRSMVGLLPLAAVAIFEEGTTDKLENFKRHANELAQRHPELIENIHMPRTPGVAGRRMLSLVSEEKLRRILDRMLDETEFLGPHGIRALSRYHLDHPFVFHVGNQEYRVGYLPADSDSGLFGGNSNWRGPVWMPVNFLLYVSLMRLAAYYGDTVTVECPTGSGRYMTLFQVANELGERLISTFLRGPDGRRPVFGGSSKFQNDPHWRDCLLFYEYFHGDNGAGIGASHQTGWTGLVARVIAGNALLTNEMVTSRDFEKGIMKVAAAHPQVA